VAVEKLAHSEFAKIGSRQDALQTISPSLLDIFYHPIFDFFQKNRLFQQPQDFPTSIRLEQFRAHLPKVVSEPDCKKKSLPRRANRSRSFFNGKKGVNSKQKVFSAMGSHAPRAEHLKTSFAVEQSIT